MKAKVYITERSIAAFASTRLALTQRARRASAKTNDVQYMQKLSRQMS
jgi:hypothetical protein